MGRAGSGSRPPATPRPLGKAKNTLIGAFIGLGIAGLAFIGPRIFIDLVIKPVGGVSVETETGLNCDGDLPEPARLPAGCFHV